MVTEMFLGCTVSCTHCRSSEAKRWGSSARSQRSLREHLGGWNHHGEEEKLRNTQWGDEVPSNGPPVTEVRTEAPLSLCASTSATAQPCSHPSPLLLQHPCQTHAAPQPLQSSLQCSITSFTEQMTPSPLLSTLSATTLFHYGKCFN